MSSSFIMDDSNKARSITYLTEYTCNYRGNLYLPVYYTYIDDDEDIPNNQLPLLLIEMSNKKMMMLCIHNTDNGRSTNHM